MPFRIRTLFSSIWPIDTTQSGATILGQNGPGSIGNRVVLRIPPSASITETSPSDFLVSYQDTRCGSFTHLQRCSRCILQPHPAMTLNYLDYQHQNTLYETTSNNHNSVNRVSIKFRSILTKIERKLDNKWSISKKKKKGKLFIFLSYKNEKYDLNFYETWKTDRTTRYVIKDSFN